MKTLAEMGSKEGIFFFVFLGDVVFNFSIQRVNNF